MIPNVPGRVRKWLIPGVDVPSGLPVSIAEGGTGATTAVAALANLLPIGLGPLPWPTATAPSGWVLCYGQAISRTTYAALFAIISTTYGTGDGSTTFNVPDMRGRVPFGKDDLGGSAASRLTNSATGGITGSTLGNTGGEQAHTDTVTESASHTHTFSQSSTGTTGGAAARWTSSSAGTGAMTSSGGDGAHNTVPPGIVVGYIMFAGV